MFSKRVAILCGLLFAGGVASPAFGQQTETIVLLRHGEKPTEEIGQINSQGLNRALALRRVDSEEVPAAEDETAAA